MNVVSTLFVTKLTSGKHLNLFPEEVSCFTTENVAIPVKNDDERSVGPVFVQITSHRMLIFPFDQAFDTIDPRSNQDSFAAWISLSNVVSVLDQKLMFRKSLNVIVNLSGNRQIILRFTSGGKESFISAACQSIERHCWTVVSIDFHAPPTMAAIVSPKPIPPPVTSNLSVASRAGVGGIIRVQQDKMRQEKVMASEALSDLKNLMKLAKEAVGMIEKYADRIRQNEGGGDSGDVEGLQVLLRDVGIVSPVTRSAVSSTSLYHKELARQIGEYLTTGSASRLSKLGGCISLTDLFCLYNRARGMELVSPDDLSQACACEQILSSVGLSRIVFSSGVVMLQSLDSVSNVDRIVNEIEGLVGVSPNQLRKISCAIDVGVGVTVHTLSKRLSLSVGLTREFLQVSSIDVNDMFRMQKRRD